MPTMPTPVMLRSLLAAALAVAAAVLPATAAEEPRHPREPMLWKVEGEGLEKPSWLFGTIHVGGGPVSVLHPAAERAFTGADVVCTEIPLDPKSQIGLAARVIRDDGRTLSDSIGEELTKRLDAELKLINPELDSTPFQSLRTWSVGVTLPLLEAQLSGAKALDQLLWDRATKEGRETGAIEEPEDQFRVFDSFTEAEQVTMLRETLRLMEVAREEGSNPVGDLVQAYVEGDDEALLGQVRGMVEEMMRGEARKLNERLLKVLIDKRNIGMAEAIDKRLRGAPAKSQFFAAGVAHYIGDDSVVDLLRKEGYRVSRIAAAGAAGAP